MMVYLAVAGSLIVLVWSADKFVEGSAATARHFGIPPLLIGMVIVGFGTSAPEIVVSVISAIQGNPGIALGNAYGSNITNIALILGITAVLYPISVQSRILKKELPVLMVVTLLAAFQLRDGKITRFEAVILLVLFMILMLWSILQGMIKTSDPLETETEKTLIENTMPLFKALILLSMGMILLIASSRILVWGAVKIARGLGVSDIIMGLTVVAIGTSLPELASSIIAVRKGNHDIALGNILGSYLFNILAVVGLAGTISPMQVGNDVLTRDIPVMGGLTVSLFIIGYGFKGPGRINRFEGALLLLCYIAYNYFIARGIFSN